MSVFRVMIFRALGDRSPLSPEDEQSLRMQEIKAFRDFFFFFFDQFYVLFSLSSTHRIIGTSSFFLTRCSAHPWPTTADCHPLGGPLFFAYNSGVFSLQRRDALPHFPEFNPIASYMNWSLSFEDERSRNRKKSFPFLRQDALSLPSDFARVLTSS